MTSETRTPHGEVPGSRHGRLLASVAYQLRMRSWRSEPGTASGSPGPGSDGSDVALENARLSKSGQAFTDGAGTTLTDALDGHQVLKVCG